MSEAMVSDKEVKRFLLIVVEIEFPGIAAQLHKAGLLKKTINRIADYCFELFLQFSYAEDAPANEQFYYTIADQVATYLTNNKLR